MYLETHLIPTKRDEWIINLHLQDGTKIEARVVKGYRAAVEETKAWAAKLENCEYSIGGMGYNQHESK